MESNRNPLVVVLAILVLMVLAFAAAPARACTVFVLTDASHALFCNNEDWYLPNTRIWFQPAGKGHYGAAYVGFDNGLTQGGLNTEGLAFDWVMVYRTPQKWEPGLPTTRSPGARQMLETCATVKDAIAFYRTYTDPAFTTSALIVADRSGASAIIGMRSGQLVVDESGQSRVFGFGRRFVQTALDRRAALDQPPEPTVAEAFKILYDSRQVGQYSTKYSNVFDLKSCDIFVRSSPERAPEAKLSLAAELKKGAHYYEIPRVTEQLAQAPRPLPLNMKRFPLEEVKPIPDKEPKVTAHVRAMVLDLAQGTPRAEDYTADLWEAEILPGRGHAEEQYKRLGEIVSLTLVERGVTNGLRSYRYRLELTSATMLGHVVVDAQNRVSVFATEDLEWKPEARLGGPPKPVAGPSP